MEELNETQIREVVDTVLSEEGLKNFIKIFEKEHNLFRGTHEKMGVPPVIVENYYTSEYLNERLWDVDGDNLYYDKGWVGLGKKPDFPLDVLGNTNIVGDVGITGAFDVLGDVSLDGAAVFNDSGLGKNFRIESLNDAYAFFLNAGDDLIGIREPYPTALVHIHARAVDGVPALNLEAGANGEIVTPDGQVLRIGHWNSGTQTFTERMKMDSAGLWYVSYLPTGSVVFAGAGGELKHNSNLYWDNSAEKLGINTFPLEALSVDGKLRLEGGSYSLISNFETVGREILCLRAKSAATDGAGINLYGDADSSYPGQIKLFTNNTTGLTIDTDQLVTIKDLSITTPVNIYNLSHDLFADFVVAEHLSLPNTIANVLTDHTKAIHDALGLGHASLSGLLLDDHSIYSLVDGTRAFTGTVGGITPTLAAHLATKGYVDSQVGGVNEFTELTDTPGSYIGQTGKFVKVNATPDGLEFADIVSGDLPSHNHVKVDITDTPWAWTDVSKVGSNLTDLATRQHAGLSDITSDQHHTQVHVLSGANHSAAGLTVGHVIRATGAASFAWQQLQHGDLGGISNDQHHAQSHTLASHSTKAHTELTGVTSDLHHAQVHETSHRSGGGDALDHDLLAGFVAAEHLSLPNTIANVLSDHNLAAHTALGLFDESSDVDHDLTTNFVAAKHLSLPNTIANVLSDHNKAAHDALGLDHDSLSGVSADDHHAQAHTLASHSTKAHTELTGVTSDQHHAQIHAASHHVGGGDLINHDSLTGFVAAEHLSLPNTIANVLSNHTKAVHDALGINADLLDDQHGSYYAPTTTKLDDWATPDDNVDLNASITRHGLLPKLGGGTVNFLRADGAWAAPTPSVHDMITGHSASGLTAGYVIVATGATTFAWAQLGHAALAGVTANQHHAQSHTLASHSTKAHSELTGVTSDLHHAQLHEAAHRSGGGDALNHDNLAGFVAAEHLSLPNTIANVLSNHTKAVHDSLALDHASLGNVLANQHHAQSHSLGSHSTKAHTELTGVTSGQHHAQLHEASHRSGGGDALNHDNLAGFLAAEHLSLPNTIANVLSDHTKAVHNALNITQVGTIGTGVWQGTAIANAYIAGINQNLLTTSNVQFNQVLVAINKNIVIGNYTLKDTYHYSSSYRYLQIGVVSGTKSLSLGVDVSGNPSGAFGGNEIFFPHNVSMLAPNAANNAFLNVLKVASNTQINIGGNYIGSGQYGSWVQVRSDRLHFPGTIRLTTDGSDYFQSPPIYSKTTTSSIQVRVCSSIGNLARYTSSEKYKEKITDLEIDSALIYNLRPVSFNSKCEPDDPERRFVGLIAEEVEKFIPEIVDYNEKEKPESFDYNALTVLLLKEVQRLNEEIILIKATLN